MVEVYQTKKSRLTGVSWKEVYPKAVIIYKKIKAHSKRRTYLRSKYFNNKKIFLDLFWHHLQDKYTYGEKVRRIRLFPCALELLEKSTIKPIVIQDYKTQAHFYRFYGKTMTNEYFCVQVKELKAQRWFLSVFPLRKRPPAKL